MTPGYDEDGNLLFDAQWTYLWDGENRLVEVTTAPAALATGKSAERYRYVYDSRSRRIARIVENWDADTQAWVVEKSERYVYDEWNVVAVVDAAGALVQRYVWGNDLSGSPQGAGGVGGLLAASDAASGRSWCYAYDGNGNVSAVVDLADGTKVGRYDYDAFGRTIASWGDEELAGVNVYMFSTKPLEGTGLYYYGFRYYMPTTGRWASRDPIGEEGGVNLYGFVGNRPTGRIDLLGQQTAGSTISQLRSHFKKYKSPESLGLLDSLNIFSAYSGVAVRLASGTPTLFGKTMGGWYDVDNNTIYYTPQSDNSLTTVIHELVHVLNYHSNSHLFPIGERRDEGMAYVTAAIFGAGLRLTVSVSYAASIQPSPERYGPGCQYDDPPSNGARS